MDYCNSVTLTIQGCLACSTETILWMLICSSVREITLNIMSKITNIRIQQYIRMHYQCARLHICGYTIQIIKMVSFLSFMPDIKLSILSDLGQNCHIMLCYTIKSLPTVRMHGSIFLNIWFIVKKWLNSLCSCIFLHSNHLSLCQILVSDKTTPLFYIKVTK